MAQQMDIVSKDILYGRNARRWVAKDYGIDIDELFIQWILRTNTGGYKTMIKHGGTELYYEVTYDGDGKGYDIVYFEKKDERHGS